MGIKEVTRKVVGYPDHGIEVISTKHWFGCFQQNPLPHKAHEFPQAKEYLINLVPIVSWIPRYNLGWLSGDVIAGLTAAMVVIPQGMAYAQIAMLPPQYGLYSSFLGVGLYCLFGTSKDAAGAMGPVAVTSLVVADVVKGVQASHPGQWDPLTIAKALALVQGIILVGLGLLRLGWIVEFIPESAIGGFMTGSAITIATSQLPALFGVTGFDTRAAPYKVILNTLKRLPRAKLDAAFGLSSLIALYAFRSTCLWASKKYPRRARIIFFLTVLRSVIILVIMTIAAHLFCRNRKGADGKYPIAILRDIPAGLRGMGKPSIDSNLFSAMTGKLPVATIILLLEPIATGKTLGRIGNYQVDCSQELLALGAMNIIGPFFGAYSCTGACARMALMSKSGSRTPLCGVFTAIVVLVSIYGLTNLFYWIPSSALAGVIIHAVFDLIAAPSTAYRVWRISPVEFCIWLGTLLIIVFSSVANGIYLGVGSSLLVLLYRIAHPTDRFLGRVQLESESGSQRESREVYVPLKPNGIINPNVTVMPPAPGVVVYRLEENFLYPNSSAVNSSLVAYVKENMRQGRDFSNIPLQDRTWSDGGPRTRSVLEQAKNDRKPWLHAVVLDFSSIPRLDTTSTQALVDARAEIEKFTDYPVEFHFASILSPWSRRALVAGGFGYGPSHSRAPREIAPLVPYYEPDMQKQHDEGDIETGDIKVHVRDEEKAAETRSWEPLMPQETPFFHLDLQSAIRAAESGSGRVLAFDYRKELEKDGAQ